MPPDSKPASLDSIPKRVEEAFSGREPPLQRLAVIKLTRPVHDMNGMNSKFLQALEEFGLWRCAAKSNALVSGLDLNNHQTKADCRMVIKYAIVVEGCEFGVTVRSIFNARPPTARKASGV